MNLQAILGAGAARSRWLFTATKNATVGSPIYPLDSLALASHKHVLQLRRRKPKSAGACSSEAFDDGRGAVAA